MSRRRKIGFAIAGLLIMGGVVYDASGMGEAVHSIVMAVGSIVKSLLSIIEIMLNAVKAGVSAVSS